MADIELVIKIPEETYEQITSLKWLSQGRENGKQLLFTLVNAVQDGTPLPKGHGELKDVGWLLSKMNNVDADTLPRTPNEYYAWRFAQSLLTQTPTIIEADKESKDADSN